MMWGYDDDRWRMHDHDGAGWVMALLILLLVAAVVVAVVAFLRGTTPASRTPGASPAGRAVDARGILQERFARGEIDEQEYRARMRALDETGG
jgi:putative membrane protein